MIFQVETQDIKDEIEKTRETSKFLLLIQKSITSNFEKIVLCILAIIGLSFRFWISSSKIGYVDENEALSFIIGKDFSHGSFSINRYGYYFAGTIEYLIATPIIAIVKSLTISRLVIAITFLIITSIIYYYGFLRTQYRKTMRLVIACLWIWPGFLLITTTKFSGLYATLLLLQVAILVSAYYAAHSLINKKYFLIFTFLSGLSLWVFPPSIVTSAVSYYWIIKSSPGLKPQRIKGLGFFVLGSILFFVLTINEKGKNLIQLYNSAAKPISNSNNSLKSLSDSYSITLDSKRLFIFSHLSLFVSIIFMLCIITLFTFLALGIKLTLKTKTSDFSFLILLLGASELVLVLIFFILRINTPSAFFVLIIVPTIFLILHSTHNKFFLSLIILTMVTTSAIYIHTQENIYNDYYANNKGKAEFLVDQIAATKVFASHRIAYSITASRDLKTKAAPFDGNNFDQKLFSEVSKNTDGIIIDTNKKRENNLMLCVQTYFQTTFSSKVASNMKIYLIPKTINSEIAEVITQCNTNAK